MSNDKKEESAGDSCAEGSNTAPGLREFLRRIFPLSATEEERRRFLGPVGRWFLRDSRGVSSDERYLAFLALITMYRVSLPFGILLLVFFNYLAVKRIDVDAYTAIIFSSDKPLQSTGIVGLYSYYYAQIMGSAVLTIAVMCFVLFLIHVKRGEVFPLRASPLLDTKEKRTFINLTKAFLLYVAAGVFLYYMVGRGIYGTTALSVIRGYLHDLSPAGTLLWEIVCGVWGIGSQSFGAVIIYAALMAVWSIIFRYDKAYDELHKI